MYYFTFGDLTFVDYTAKALVLLMIRKNLINDTFHLENPYQISWKEMDLFLEKIGIKIQILNPELFFEFLMENLNEKHQRNKIVRFLLHSGLLESENKRYTKTKIVSDRTDMILKKLGFE